MVRAYTHHASLRTQPKYEFTYGGFSNPGQLSKLTRWASWAAARASGSSSASAAAAASSSSCAVWSRGSQLAGVGK